MSHVRKLHTFHDGITAVNHKDQMAGQGDNIEVLKLVGPPSME